MIGHDDPSQDAIAAAAVGQTKGDGLEQADPIAVGGDSHGNAIHESLRPRRRRERQRPSWLANEVATASHSWLFVGLFIRDADGTSARPGQTSAGSAPIMPTRLAR